jgi:hypothetical protein
MKLRFKKDKLGWLRLQQEIDGNWVDVDLSKLERVN